MTDEKIDEADEINLGGAPSKYDPQFDDDVYELCLLGATDREIGAFFGVCKSTVNNWKKDHPSFYSKMKLGKIGADMRVAQSLYNAAVNGDVSAARYWLNNRRREQWREKQDHELTGKDGAPLTNEITVTVVRPQPLEG